jgi:Cu/Ag efflux pump CusA
VIAAAIAVLVAMLLLLQAALRSWRLAALTFLTVPAALVGGVLTGLLVDGTTLSLGALLGLLGTFAVAVRGAIVLVSHFQRLEDDGGSGTRSRLVQLGAREQFGPITAAALATAAFLLPFVVLGSRVGLEIVHPLATVMLGGLVTATVMSLFVLPALYAGFAGKADRDVASGLLQRWAGVEEAPVTNGHGNAGGPDAAASEHDHQQVLTVRPSTEAATLPASPAEGS